MYMQGAVKNEQVDFFRSRRRRKRVVREFDAGRVSSIKPYVTIARCSPKTSATRPPISYRRTATRVRATNATDSLMTVIAPTSRPRFSQPSKTLRRRRFECFTQNIFEYVVKINEKKLVVFDVKRGVFKKRRFQRRLNGLSRSKGT